VSDPNWLQEIAEGIAKLQDELGAALPQLEKKCIHDVILAEYNI
jgi:hypothetical protein